MPAQLSGGATSVTATGRYVVSLDKTSAPSDNIVTIGIGAGTWTATATIVGNPFTSTQDPTNLHWQNIASMRLDTLAIENTPTITSNTARTWLVNAAPFAQVGLNISAITGTIPLVVESSFSPAGMGIDTVAALSGAFSGAVTSSSPTGGVGYATGAGGAVTQATSRTTGVTINNVCGSITLVSAAGSATPFSFTVTNSTVAATDTITISQKSGTDKYTTQVVSAVAAGSFQLTLANASGTTTEQPVFSFAVHKAVAS